MVTFEEARQIVLDAARKNWHAGMGKLTTAPDGFESEKLWMVRAVAQQELDGDDAFVQMDEPVYLVHKDTGKVRVTTYLAESDQIDSMAPVGGS